jgi:hypothetical protein
MMKATYGFAIGLVLATGGLAAAQVPVAQPVPVPTRVREVQPAPIETTAPVAPVGMQRVSQILGSTVQLQGSNSFGRVEDAILDNNGALSYLVVSNNGRRVMLPWSAGNFNLGQRMISYDVTPQAIQPLYFEGTTWPNVWAAPYATRVRQVFPRAGIFRREVLRPAGVVPAR